MKINLADWVTASRIFLAFLIFSLLMGRMPYARIFAAILFCLAGLTDYFDGKIARKYGGGTAFGKFFDPLADKVLVILILTGLAILKEIPFWMVILIVIREIFVTFLRGGNVEKFSPTVLAKSKTAIQMFGTAVMLFMPCLVPMLHRGGIFLKVGVQQGLNYIIMTIILLVTIISGVQYFFIARGKI